MPVPTTHISLHLIDKLEVRTETSLGHPLLLSAETMYGRTSLTLFFRDETMSALIADAIKTALEIRAAEHNEPPVDLRQVYAAEAYAYRGSDR